MHPTIPSAPTLSSAARVRLAPAAPSLWRVIDPGGRVIGHLAARAEEAGTRYEARLLQVETHTFRPVGEFWSADDAVDCLRFTR